jgi:putative DNA primase/helicase
MNDVAANAAAGSQDPLERLRQSEQTPAFTEQSVMRMFVEENKDRLRYNHTSKDWLVWNGHYWKADGKQRAFAWALALCRSLGKGAVIQKIRFSRAVEEASRAQPELATEAAEWDQNVMLLGTPDGVVDLTTGKLRPGRPEDMISKITACAPADDDDCPKWKAFLEYAFDGKANIGFFRRCCGYSLTGSVEEEVIVFLVRREGTGKGTITTTLLATFKDYGIPVPVRMFTDSGCRQVEYYKAQLHGKRLAVAAEPEKDAAWSEGFINELRGDKMDGRHPSGRPFNFDPLHKQWFHGNSIPALKGVASGIRRRLKILKLDRKPDKPDPKLKEALRAELPGILRWMINGGLEWRRDGLKPPSDVEAAVEEYFATQDVFGRWIEECCDLIPTAQNAPNALRINYNAWADRNQEPRKTFASFHDAIRLHPLLRQGKTRGNLWVRGIAIKPQPSRYDPGRDDPDDPEREFLGGRKG